MSHLAEALLKRYRDAYRIAEGTVKIGKLVKLASLFGGAAASILGVYLAFRGDFEVTNTIGVALALCGAMIASFGFMAGIMLSAQGQIMLAMLDAAVNTSPNAEPAEKATIMGIR